MGEQKRSLLRQLYLPAVLCTALWGSAAPCVKRGYELFAVSADAPFSQLVFAGWRFALAGILVLLVTRLKGHRIVPKRDEIKPILAISLFQSMLQYVCYYIGLSGTTGTKGSVLSGTQTFFALLLAHCLLPNDKLNRRKTLGCICGFAGVLALGLGGLNGFNLTGDGLVLLSDKILLRYYAALGENTFYQFTGGSFTSSSTYPYSVKLYETSYDGIPAISVVVSSNSFASIGGLPQTVDFLLQEFVHYA